MTTAQIIEIAQNAEAPTDIHPNELDITMATRREDNWWGIAWFDGLKPRPAFVWVKKIKDAHRITKIIREEGALWEAQQRLAARAEEIAAAEADTDGDGSKAPKSSNGKSSASTSKRSKATRASSRPTSNGNSSRPTSSSAK